MYYYDTISPSIAPELLGEDGGVSLSFFLERITCCNAINSVERNQYSDNPPGNCVPITTVITGIKYNICLFIIAAMLSSFPPSPAAFGGFLRDKDFACQYCAAPASNANTIFGLLKSNSPSDIGSIVPGSCTNEYSILKSSLVRPACRTQYNAIKMGN